VVGENFGVFINAAAAEALTGAELVPVVASSVTKQATTQQIANLASNPRVTSIASSSTPTPNCGTTDIYTITNLAVGATFGAPTGLPADGQILIFRILDDGTAQALAWNVAYVAGSSVPLPTTTVISKWLYVGFRYNSAASAWHLLAVNQF